MITALFISYDILFIVGVLSLLKWEEDFRRHGP